MATIRRRKRTKGVRYEWRVSRAGHKTVYGTCPTLACARECSRKAEEDLLAGIDHGLRVRDLLDRFAEARLPEIPDSAKMYQRHIVWWKAALGDVVAGSLSPKKIAEAREALRAEVGPRGHKRSPATVNRYLNTLSSCFRWALGSERSLVDHNPVRDVGRDRERGRDRFLSRPKDEPGGESEIERLFAALKGSESKTLGDLVTVLLFTGCRVGEILAMEVAWVRLPERGFSIPAEVTKTEKARFVPLEGEAFTLIQRRVEAARLARRRFLFPGKSGDKPATFPYKSWNRLLRRAGIANFRPHDLRHSAASYLVMDGRSLPEVGQQLGHTSVQSTARYAHFAPSHSRKTSRDLAKLIKGWKPE